MRRRMDVWKGWFNPYEIVCSIQYVTVKLAERSPALESHLSVPAESGDQEGWGCNDWLQ